MIKTYRYNANRNTVSHILQGKNGVTVRYNFERGNVITKQKPEIILKYKYAQDLLENSELFKQGLVTLVSSIAEPSDVIDKEPTKTESPTKAETKKNVVEIVSVTSVDELLAFVNNEDNRNEDTMFKTPTRALKWATEHNFSFPNYNPE